MKISDSLFNKSIAHDSGAKHVSGLAKYTDDISEPLGTLYGAYRITDSKCSNDVL